MLTDRCDRRLALFSNKFCQSLAAGELVAVGAKTIFAYVSRLRLDIYPASLALVKGPFSRSESPSFVGTSMTTICLTPGRSQKMTAEKTEFIIHNPYYNTLLYSQSISAVAEGVT